MSSEQVTLTLPATATEAAAAQRSAPGAHLRAGGTDLQERRHRGITSGPLIDLNGAAGMDDVRLDGARLEIGALCRIQAVADHPLCRQHAPGLALAAGALATPQIRAVGTLGGNLAQRTRCWYYRSPDWICLKKGGATCHAAEGDHRWHALFRRSPCVAVHASSLAVALLAAEAEIQAAGAWQPIEAWLGDGADPLDRPLPLITAIRLPGADPVERAAYHRAISRARAEWPLVECVASLVVRDGKIVRARVAVGAVAAVPLRLRGVESKLEGRAATAEVLAEAAEAAAEGAAPLEGTRYKIPLLGGCVLECLERAAGQGAG